MKSFVIEEKEPCLVQARQGFSVLYADRWLYSRYAPEKAICSQIESLQIQEETLVLAFSPAAGYGLDNLIAKLPESCHIVTIEHDPYLFAFFARTCPREPRLHPKVTNAFFSRPEEITSYLLSRYFLPDLSKYRRILTISMSGGTDLYPDFYRQLTTLANETLFSFWKNQLTLHHLGKLFNTNSIRNIPVISGSSSVPFPLHTVDKPLLVTGAGPSAEATLSWLASHPEFRNTLYLLSVDAAVTAVTSHGLQPDGVVAVESQIAVEKAYIGWKTADSPQPHLFADCTSRPSVARGFSKVSFFATRFCETTLFAEASWIQRYNKLCTDAGIPGFPPQGSVGNAAVEIALALRIPDIPVFITGLDFSYTPGETHTKHSPQFNAVLSTSQRTKPPANYGAAWNDTVQIIQGKGNRRQITGGNLAGYAELFARTHNTTPLLFDLGTTGLPLGIPCITTSELERFLTGLTSTSTSGLNTATEPYTGSISDKLHTSGIRLLISEKKRLEAILESLSGARQFSDTQLTSSIKDCSYLFMHFPDSTLGVRDDPDFLKRIKAEATWFHKQVTTALNELNQQDQ